MSFFYLKYKYKQTDTNIKASCQSIRDKLSNGIMIDPTIIRLNYESISAIEFLRFRERAMRFYPTLVYFFTIKKKTISRDLAALASLLSSSYNPSLSFPFFFFQCVKYLYRILISLHNFVHKSRNYELQIKNFF